MSLLSNLGFSINMKKSLLIPRKVFDWLELQWNLRYYTLGIPSQKRKREVSMVRCILWQAEESKNHFMAFFSSCRLQSPFTRLKDFQMVWRGNSQEKSLPQPISFRRILKPWSRVSTFNKVVLLSHHPHGYVKVGLEGGVTQIIRFVVSTLPNLSHQCSELMAATCLSRGSILLDDLSYGLLWATIELFCASGEEDRAPSLKAVVVVLEKLREKNNWFLTAVHLPGVKNILAASRLRDFAQKTEWSLNQESFLEVQAVLPELQVDLLHLK